MPNPTAQTTSTPVSAEADSTTKAGASVTVIHISSKTSTLRSSDGGAAGSSLPDSDPGQTDGGSTGTHQISPGTPGSDVGTTTSAANPGGIIVSVLQHTSTTVKGTTKVGSDGASSVEDEPGKGASQIQSQGGPGASATVIANPGGIIVSVLQHASFTKGSDAASIQGSSDPAGSSNSAGIDNGAGGDSSSAGDSSSDGSGEGSSSNDAGSDTSGTTSNDNAGSGSDPAAGTTVTIGSSAFTVASRSKAGGGSAIVVAAGSSTVTLSTGDTTDIAGQSLSAPTSGGVVIGSGSAIVTVSPTPQKGVAGSEGSVSVTTAAVVTVGSTPFTASAVAGNGGGSAIVVAAAGSIATLQPGQSATLAGQTVSAPSSGGIVVGSGVSATTLSLAASIGTGTSDLNGADVEHTAGGAALTLTVGGQAVVASLLPAFSSAVVVDGHTLSESGDAITIDTHTFSAVGDGIVIDGTSTAIMPTALAFADSGSTVFSIGSQIFTLSAADSQATGVVLLDRITLLPGQVVTIGGHTFSSVQSGVVVDGSQTISITGSAAAAQTTVLTLGGTIYSAQAAGDGVVIVDGATILPGQLTVLNSHTFSDGPGGLVIDGSTTVALATPTVFDVQGTAYTVKAADSGAVVIDGHTLLPGQTTVIGSHTFSDGPQGLVVDGSTIINAPSLTKFTIAGAQFTAYEVPGQSGVDVVDDVTLSPGQVATIDGHTFSDVPSGLVVDGSHTVSLISGLVSTAVGPLETAGDAKAAATTSASGARQVDRDYLLVLLWSAAMIFVCSV